ncbi:MAG TPA: tetratricopeptide repeat protein, partial [Chloroflexia bacterium]|nr:tetratricopeptide repeat protein [Chloroflexia bacterium]
RAGQGQVIGIGGEAGLGKSRLLAATLDAARTAGWAVYSGAAQSYGTQTAYLAWQAVWQAFFDLDPIGPPEEQAGALEERLATIDSGLLERLPLLGPALGVALPDTALTASMEPALRQQSLAALLIACLREHVQATPVLLALEDAHWLDPLSHDLLVALARAIPALPVVLLLAYRPGEPGRPAVPDVATLPHFGELALSALAPDAAHALVATGLAAAGRAPAPGVVAALVERGAGNPFYLEELVRYLQERGVDPGDAAAVAGVAWPPSLGSLLLARIDQVTEAPRRVLKVASILGLRFGLPHLWGVYPELGTAEAVSAALDILARVELAPLDTPEPVRTHRFQHALTREVTYGSLPEEVRQRFHEQFAAWLEGQGSADLDLLAYHYGQSANATKRRLYLQRAGDAAAVAWANGAAAGYYAQLLAELPADDPARAPVLRALGAVLERQGAWDDAAARYTAAHAAAATAGDRAAAAAGLGLVRHRQGAYAEAIAWLEQARDAYGAAGDAAGAARALAELGRVYQLQGEYEAANTVLAACRAAAQAAGDRATEAQVLNNLGLVAHAQGAYPAARALFAASLDLRQTLGDRWGIAMALNNLGLVAHEQGEYAAARAYHEQSLGLRQVLGDRWGITMSLNNLGRVVYAQGAPAAAEALFVENLALQRELGDRWGSALSLNNLGELAHERGAPEAARALFAESLALSRAVGDRWGIAMSLANLGRVAQDQGAWAMAQTLYEESLALSRALGAREDIAMALTDLGLVALEQGDRRLAAARLGESLDLARALGPGQTARNALVGAAAVIPSPAGAARVLGAVTGLLQAQETTLQPAVQRRYEQVAATARAALGAAPYQAAFAAGQALLWDAALAAARTALAAAGEHASA